MSDELKREIDRATCRYCRAGKPLIDGYHEWETVDGDWHGRSRVKCEQDIHITAAVLPLFDRVIVASFEQAVWAIEEAHRRNTSWENAMSRFRNFILAQIPAKVRLRAEIRELERIKAEAEWWWDYARSQGAHPCDPPMKHCAHESCQRLAAISQELAEKRAQLTRLENKCST